MKCRSLEESARGCIGALMITELDANRSEGCVSMAAARGTNHTGFAGWPLARTHALALHVSRKVRTVACAVRTYQCGPGHELMAWPNVQGLVLAKVCKSRVLALRCRCGMDPSRAQALPARPAEVGQGETTARPHKQGVQPGSPGIQAVWCFGLSSSTCSPAHAIVSGPLRRMRPMLMVPRRHHRLDHRQTEE